MNINDVLATVKRLMEVRHLVDLQLNEIAHGSNYNDNEWDQLTPVERQVINDCLNWLEGHTTTPPSDRWTKCLHHDEIEEQQKVFTTPP